MNRGVFAFGIRGGGEHAVEEPVSFLIGLGSGVFPIMVFAIEGIIVAGAELVLEWVTGMGFRVCLTRTFGIEVFTERATVAGAELILEWVAGKDVPADDADAEAE